MSRAAPGVRKGAWTQEEDILLRNCIAKYGEGKWHLIPIRAGLNRCRKSCRLRWLNYLRPDIKRGDFSSDEVDLIIRLHKLLGNRWSLIAGRLPGRTANDVKNYWNTHFLKKMAAIKEQEEGKASKTKNCGRTTTTPKIATSRNVIFKPLPRAFSRNGYWQTRGKAARTTETPRTIGATQVKDSSIPAPNSVQNEKDSGSNSSATDQYWWDNLLLNLESEGTTWPCFGGGSGTVENDMSSLDAGELSNLQQQAKEGVGDPCNQQGDQFVSSGSLTIDSEFWDLLL